MEQNFDLVVLGAGSGGLAAAKRAASYGAKVAIVEGDRVGGTCVIRGCVPKKLLVYGSLVSEQLEAASSYGVTVERATFDTSVLLNNVREEVNRLNARHIEFLAKNGVELITGWGRFIDPHRIGVSSVREGEVEQVLQAKRVMIAVGGRPIRPDLPGAELAWVSDDMFLQERFPDQVVVVGAGFIACEFAGILRGLGVGVTQLVRREGLLRGFDTELSAAVAEGMKEKGIDLRFKESPVAIEGRPNDLTVVTKSGERLPCGGVLLATGRQPFLAGLGLDAAGVLVDGRRIPVDANQATNLSHVFAVGDVTERICLTPVAVDEGRAFADSVFGGVPRQVNHSLVASAVFSQPELATVGLSEEDAIAKLGADQVVVHRARFRAMSQALPKHGPRCLLKLVVEASSKKVLGCHMIGEHAAEIIQMAAIAVGMGATKADFDRTMALHPTVSEEFVTMA
ncbi:MAG: glutathione-disulfide reductase [Propionibacteriaceae bacterium]|nr:glutathione-disulfide reductase [Propionibacteriaceae bacterium]